MHTHNVSTREDYELLPTGSKKNLRPNIRRMRSDPVIKEVLLLPPAGLDEDSLCVAGSI